MNSLLKEKSKAFALQIIKVCNEVKEKKRESVLTNQLNRSGTSVSENGRRGRTENSRKGGGDRDGFIGCGAL